MLVKASLDSNSSYSVQTLGDIQAARYAKDWMLENQPKPAKSAKGPKPIDKVGEALRQKIQGGKV